jgi:hypothetical protein
MVLNVSLFKPKSWELASAFVKEGRSASWRVLQSAGCHHQQLKTTRSRASGRSGGTRCARSG